MAAASDKDVLHTRTHNQTHSQPATTPAAIFVVIIIRYLYTHTFVRRETKSEREEVRGVKKEMVMKLIYLGTSDVPNVTVWG